MAKMQSSFFNMLLVLTAVTLAAAVSLGFVYELTRGPIEKARLARQMRAINAVLGEYSNDPWLEQFKVLSIHGEDSVEFFPATVDGTLTGMAVKGYSSKGYNGDIWIMVGFKVNGDISNVYVIEHRETPGLGSKINDESFIDQFTGRDPQTSDMRVTKDGGEINAISGATITSRAFSEAVVKASKEYKKYLEHAERD